MPKETMTPRERWDAILKRETPDRVPMDYWATWEATQNLLTYLGCDFDEALRRLHIDIPFDLHPKYVGPPPKEGEDIWGCRQQRAEYGSGGYNESVSHPLAAYETVEEIQANYRFPQPDDYDCSHMPAVVKGQEHRPIRGGGSEPFLQYKLLRGDEQAYVDLLLNPEIVHYCLDKMFGLAYELSRRTYETVPGMVNITFVAEDLGSQNGLLFSLEHIREFLFPHMKRMVDLAKEAGAWVFMHSDGACRDIIPDLIEMGYDALNPLQWQLSGMDREGLRRDFGEDLIFHGGVDNQKTIPFGTAEDVRQEVADNLRILGEGGGYILAPCHNIQDITPPENIVALYEAGYEFGWR